MDRRVRITAHAESPIQQDELDVALRGIGLDIDQRLAAGLAKGHPYSLSDTDDVPGEKAVRRHETMPARGQGAALATDPFR